MVKPLVSARAVLTRVKPQRLQLNRTSQPGTFNTLRPETRWPKAAQTSSRRTHRLGRDQREHHHSPSPCTNVANRPRWCPRCAQRGGAVDHGAVRCADAASRQLQPTPPAPSPWPPATQTKHDEHHRYVIAEDGCGGQRWYRGIAAALCRLAHTSVPSSC